MSDMINDLLLDERLDDWIFENLMYQNNFGWDDERATDIKDSGKEGHKRIIKTMKYIQKFKNVKL